MEKNNYTADTIQKLSFFDAVRKAPGMYIGSRDADGLQHLVKEIVSNSVDEFLNSNCNEIRVNINDDGSLTVKDNGRGIPYGKKGDLTALEMCFTQEHAGGKFLNATGESGYNSAGGMHGLGTKCVNALSDKMIVKSYVNNKVETIEFINGVANKHTYEDGVGVGLSVQFYPSSKYLEETKFDADRIRTMLREFSFLNQKLKFIFNDNEIFYSDRGLYDYLDYLNGKHEYLIEPLYFNKADGSFQIEGAVGYNKSYSNITRLYTNSIPQEKVTHLTGFRTAWTTVLNSYARSKKWLKEKEDNLSGNDLAEGQLLVLNFKMIDPVFKGQNKEELSSTEGRTYVQRLASEAINDYCITHEKDVKLIIDKALSARRAREAAQKAREKAREGNIKGLKAKMQLSDKFIDCTSKKPEDRNLLLVEGLSAGGSCIEARNVKTDCIYMLRGKTISPLRTSIDKILANQEMSDIIRVIGAGFGDKFDVNKMQFNKIVITSDQDADGMDIALLLTTFFFTYMRPLVEAGKLYRAVTPLYIITSKKGKEYCYTEDELENWKQNNKDIKYELAHCKGLGEVSAEVLHEICFENQRFKRITVSDCKKTEELLNILQGPSANLRKQYIYNNATNLGFNWE